MKQLKKISLRKVSDVLNDMEMKQVLGGLSSKKCPSGCTGECTDDVGAVGKCYFNKSQSQCYCATVNKGYM
jgi:natural product precursor